MHVLDGYVEGYELIDKPRYVEDTVVLGHCHEVVIFRILFSEFRHKAALAAHVLLHVIETDVAWHVYGAVYREVEVEIALRAVYAYVHAHVAASHLGSIYGLEVSVVKVVMQGGVALLQPFQVYLKRL